MQLKYIDIELIDIDKQPARFRFNGQDKSIIELKKSLETYGQLHPVVVQKKDDGRFSLICGSRRLLAARQAGMRFITAIVYDQVQQEDACRIFLMENLHRKKINPLDMSLICQQLKSRLNTSYEQIGRILNLRTKTIQRYLKLLSLSQKAKDALRDNLIGFRQAVLLAQVDDAVQSKLVDEIVSEKLSTRELEQKIIMNGKISCLSIRFSEENWKEELTSKIMEILDSLNSKDENGHKT